VRRFSFPLDRVLDLRRHELQTAQAKLGEIQRAQLQSRLQADSLREEIAQRSDEVALARVITGDSLRRRGAYLVRLTRNREKELAAGQAWEQKRQEQAQRVVEIRRQVKLLELLRSRKHAAHLAAIDRERENQASEFFLAKWVRERRFGMN